MSHTIPVSDELYDRIAKYAQQHAQSVETVANTCLAAGVEQVIPATGEGSPAYVYDPASDPILPFIGAFDSGDLPALEPHEHDLYFAGGANGKQEDTGADEK